MYTHACIIHGASHHLLPYRRGPYHQPSSNQPTQPNPHSGAWGFDGYITSDCGAVADIWNRHNYTATPEETCGVALRAGTDLDCSTFYKDHAPQALASGDLREEDVDAALRHLFRVQFRLGLFDPSDGQVYAKVGEVE